MSNFNVFRKRVCATFLLVVAITLSNSAYASPPAAAAKARFKLPAISAAGAGAVTFRPLYLTGGSQLTVISPGEWEPVAEKLGDTLQRTHKIFSGLFGEIPAFNVSIRLMEENAFYKRTGAPSWTNAMYYRGEIMIPLPSGKFIDLNDISRAVTHEYTHAVLHALSKGKCPGWLDEGIAQWAEGEENPALRPALSRWLRKNPPVPLKLLQGGFTRLNTKMVPAAYAQSLIASNFIIQEFGFEGVTRFLLELRDGNSQDAAFQRAFGLSTEEFEGRLAQELGFWKNSESQARAYVDEFQY